MSDSLPDSIDDAQEDVDRTVKARDVLLIVAIAVAMVPVVKLIEAIHWVRDSR